MADVHGTLLARGRRIAYLDGLRGLAALWVVLFHFAVDGPPTSLAPRLIAVVVFSLGHLGVPIFFVLSGYVIARSESGVRTTGTSAVRFAVRRFRRIVPPYYASIAVALFLTAIATWIAGRAFALPSESYAPGALVAHLFFLQTYVGVSQINIVYWSLCYEVSFYLGFILLVWGAAAFASRAARPAKAWRLVIGSVMASSLVLAFVPLGLPFAAEPVTMFYAFLGGAMVWWREAGRFSPWALVAILMAVGLGAIERRDLFPVVVALTILLIACIRYLEVIRRVLELRPAQFLGMVSFSLFLVHVPVLRLVDAMVVRWAPGSGVHLGLVLGVDLVLAISIAWIFWLLVERPATRWARRHRADQADDSLGGVTMQPGSSSSGCAASEQVKD